MRQVNPVFSSVTGRVRFLERYGLIVHQAVALVFARRLLGCSEGIPRQRVCPVGNGVRVAFSVPARKREARVEVVERNLGAAETGACSAWGSGNQAQAGSGPGLSGHQLPE